MREITFFLNRYQDYRVCMRPSSTQIIEDVDGRKSTFSVPPRYIQFTGCLFKTSDVEEINWMRNQDFYTGRNGRTIDVFEEKALPQDPLQALVSEYGVDEVEDVVSLVRRRLEKRRAEKAVAVETPVEEPAATKKNKPKKPVKRTGSRVKAG